MALVEDGEGVEQLAAEEGAAAAVVSQRGQRGDYRKAPSVATEIRFDGPQGDDEAGLDAVLARHPIEQRLVLGQLAPALLDPRQRHHPGQVLLEAQRELGLMAIELDHPRDRFDARERAIECLRADAPRQRLAAELIEPMREISTLGPRRRHEQQCGGDQDEQ